VVPPNNAQVTAQLRTEQLQGVRADKLYKLLPWSRTMSRPLRHVDPSGLPYVERGPLVGTEVLHPL